MNCCNGCLQMKRMAPSFRERKNFSAYNNWPHHATKVERPIHCSGLLMNPTFYRHDCFRLNLEVTTHGQGYIWFIDLGILLAQPCEHEFIRGALHSLALSAWALKKFVISWAQCGLSTSPSLSADQTAQAGGGFGGRSLVCKDKPNKSSISNDLRDLVFLSKSYLHGTGHCGQWYKLKILPISPCKFTRVRRLIGEKHWNEVWWGRVNGK